MKYGATALLFSCCVPVNVFDLLNKAIFLVILKCLLYSLLTVSGFSFLAMKMMNQYIYMCKRGMLLQNSGLTLLN